MLLIRKFTKQHAKGNEDPGDAKRFTTVMLTRFNVPIPGFRQILTDKGIDHSTWLKDKRDAFFEFCLPSVLAQSCKDFTWLIAFGERTPEVEEILKACAPHDFIKPIFLAGGGAHLPSAIRDESSKDPKTEHLLSVRFDCDDALNVHFFYNLHSFARYFLKNNDGLPSDKPIAIGFPFGGKLVGDQWCATAWPNSPFLALLEKKRVGLKTVFGTPHGEIERIATARYLHTLQPMWLQVVNRNNVMNGLEKLEGPLSPVTPGLFELFGVNKVIE